MPASPTRKCAACQQDRLIAEFRDPGDVTFGRPPKFCRYCRTLDTALQDRQAQNRARRPKAVDRQRSYAARTFREHLAAIIDTYPYGEKVCPPVSGCGRSLDIGEYDDDIYQADGLATRCRSCKAERPVSDAYSRLIATVKGARR